MAQQQSQTPMPGPEEPRSLMDQAKLVGAVVAGLALLIFFFQNLQNVEINFLWFDWNTDMIWALLVSALLGAVAMFLGLAFWNRRRHPRPPRQEG